MADELDVNKVFAGHDLTLNTVHTDYPPSCLPGKFKAPSTEKAKRALFEKIDEHLYEKAARMVAFRTSVVRLVPWIKSLQLLYYEYYGKSDSFDVDWKDEPKDWTENTSSEKKICIDLLDLSLSDNKLMYKLTVFINTGLIQVQGNRKDFFVRKHFPLLTQILAKILEVNKMVRGQKVTRQKVTDKKSQIYAGQKVTRQKVTTSNHLMVRTKSHKTKSHNLNYHDKT